MPGAFIHLVRLAIFAPGKTQVKETRSGSLGVADLSQSLQAPKISVSCLFSLYIVDFSFGEQDMVEEEMRYFLIDFPYISNENF